jgi:hypothetical protein
MKPGGAVNAFEGDLGSGNGGIGGIVETATKAAPNGIGWEKWRQSGNLEDERYSPTRTQSQIAADERIAELESQHDGEPSGVLKPIVDTLMGRTKWVGKFLRNETVADLVNAVDDYINSGGPQKDIEAYHATQEYKDNKALEDMIATEFQRWVDKKKKAQPP